jgi:hypothetical protein
VSRLLQDWWNQAGHRSGRGFLKIIISAKFVFNRWLAKFFADSLTSRAGTCREAEPDPGRIGLAHEVCVNERNFKNDDFLFARRAMVSENVGRRMELTRRRSLRTGERREDEERTAKYASYRQNESGTHEIRSKMNTPGRRPALQDAATQVKKLALKRSRFQWHNLDMLADEPVTTKKEGALQVFDFSPVSNFLQHFSRFFTLFCSHKRLIFRGLGRIPTCKRRKQFKFKVKNAKLKRKRDTNCTRGRRGAWGTRSTGCAALCRFVPLKESSDGRPGLALGQTKSNQVAPNQTKIWRECNEAGSGS